MKISYIKFQPYHDIEFYKAGEPLFTIEQARAILRDCTLYEGEAEVDRRTLADACYHCFPEYTFQVCDAPADMLLGSCYTCGTCLQVLAWK